MINDPHVRKYIISANTVYYTFTDVSNVEWLIIICHPQYLRFEKLVKNPKKPIDTPQTGVHKTHPQI